jgi:hypothetical protein
MVTIYPDSSNAAALEILNLPPEDLALPDAPGEVVLPAIDHFKWFYKLSETPPDPSNRRYPHIAQDPELGGRPYCSLSEMQQ